MLLGGRPLGRRTEQHDVFAGIAETPKDLVSAIKASWPEAAGNLHVDAWRMVQYVDGYRVEVLPRVPGEKENHQVVVLWFVNLGGYAAGIFEEFHQKILVVAENRDAAVQKAKRHPFFKQFHISGGGAAHVDDKWAFDVDEVENLEFLLPSDMRQAWKIHLIPAPGGIEDDVHLGYFRLHAF